MNSLMTTIRAFIRDESGLETVEYAIAGALIVAASVAAFTLLGQNVATEINDLANVVGGGGATCCD